jgi:hypothetical protein
MNVYHAKSFLKQSQPDLSAAGTPLMDHHPSIHQPAARNKMICGWTPPTRPAIQAAQNSSLIARQDKGGSKAL